MSSSFWWFASRTDGTPIGGHLEEAFDYDGLSLIRVPVYYGDDPRGGMGAYRHVALPVFSASS